MARPKKDKRMLMNQRLPLMLTAEQKALLEEAAALAMLDLSVWARSVLLEAARKVVPATTGAGKERARR